MALISILGVTLVVVVTAEIVPKVIGKRESKSRPHAGIITAKTRGFNQHGDVCMEWTRSIMIYKRDAPQDKGVRPEPKVPFDDE